MWKPCREMDFSKAVEALKKGELVAFPTETVYGLGADGLSEQACAKIYQAKGRPSDNPLILHIADMDMLEMVAQNISQQALELARAFWPGPLTLVLDKTKVVPVVVSANLNTVGIRMPDHEVARELIRAVGRPLAAPSANTSGRPSPTQASHVVADLKTRMAGVLDGGECMVGLESTIVDCTTQPPTILRPGGISREQIEEVIGFVELSQSSNINLPKAPGMKYRHYAPNVPVYLLSEKQVQEDLFEILKEEVQVGLMLPDELINALPKPAEHIRYWNMGRQADTKTAAMRLFRGLRYLEELGVGKIYITSWPKTGIGLALMNRIEKLSVPYGG